MPMFAPAPLPDISTIQKRLERIFPEGIPDRNYVIREMAAKVVFVMLYINAVEGSNNWLTPKHVYRMSPRQARSQESANRTLYANAVVRPGFIQEDATWYADNTREPIRDETLKDGFIQKGAVLEKPGIPTTSSKGRYALYAHFANLFLLSDDDFEAKVQEWQDKHLSHAELSRIRIMHDRHSTDECVRVKLPNGETRIMSAGPSSLITKGVIEEFAKRFLRFPSVLWISESGKKVVLQDDLLMKQLGLPIDQTRLLPDLVLADLTPQNLSLIFVEVVATDGPITEHRKEQLLSLTANAGFNKVTFISAFENRNATPLKSRLSGIAVDTLIWCRAEPDLLIWLGENQELPFKPGKWSLTHS